MSPYLALLALSASPTELTKVFAADWGLANAPGVAAAVVQGGRIVWSSAAGFMDQGHKARATADSPFRVGSLTKAFTATVVLQLVSEGKLSLEDPASKFLPDLPNAWSGVTVRQLLNHTSGIPDYTAQPDFEARIRERLMPVEIVARTARKPLDFPPGSQWRYDNSGYVVLGMIVERLDRCSLADSFQRRVLRPLGLGHTRLNVDGAKAEVSGFGADGKPAAAINMTQPYAAGSVVSTANDMAKWLVAQGSERLLPARLWTEMWRSGVLTDGKSTDYGFGWQLGRMNDVPTVEHGGGIPGFITFVRRVPSKDVAVVVLTNSDQGRPGSVAQRLLETAETSLKVFEAEIADPDPKVAKATERLFLGLAKGQPDRSLMSEALSNKITAEAIESGQRFLATFGAYHGMRLVKIDGSRRTYLLRYEKTNLQLRTDRDEKDRFTAFVIQPA